MESSSSKAKQHCRKFTLNALKLATNNFSATEELGHGGFGTVYKGFIRKENLMVAVKRLNTAKLKEKGFYEEIVALSQIQHSNIVSLIGYCDEDREKIIVYEFIANRTLYDHLHKLLRDGHSLLSLNERLRILIGAARGLYHLHYCIRGGSFIHRDVKSENILLDENHVAKLADFGLAKFVSLDDPHSHVSTGGEGTPGYLDPYYFYNRKLTRASDTYSFGVTMFEVLSGRHVIDDDRPEEEPIFPIWALEKEAHEILDPVLRGSISEDSLKIICNVAKRCLHAEPKQRPEMSEVLAQLELALLTSYNESDNEDNVNMRQVTENLAFAISELEKVTKEVNSMGHGSRGSNVYKGFSSTGEIAIKRYNCQMSEQAFLAQVVTLANLDHENVAKLHGYCMTNDMDYYVYEFALGWSLHDGLHRKFFYQKGIMTWGIRIKIAVEVAKGLCYIHDEKELIHRNIKSSNVLIFEETAKITDLHLSNPCSCKSPVPLRGPRPKCELYHPPEFSKDGDSKAGDVYSFGVVLLELLTGKKPIDSTLPNGMDLVSWATPHLTSEQGNLVRWLTPQLISEEGLQMIVDDRLEKDYPLVAVKMMAGVAVSCLANRPFLRPTMDEVSENLQEALRKTQDYYREILMSNHKAHAPQRSPAATP